jgi:hypothetical protein
VDANAIDRVFHTRAAATATFDTLIITGGSIVAVEMGGAIDVDEGSTANIIDTTPSPATRPPSRVVRLRRRAGVG